MTVFRYPGNLRIGVMHERVTGVEDLSAGMVAPKQMLLLLLNGHQRFRVNQTQITLSTVMPDDPGPKALLLRIGAEAQLQYFESYGHPLVKIAITTDPDWLDHAGEVRGVAAGFGRGVQNGISHRIWTPDAAMLRLAQSITEAHRGGTFDSRRPGHGSLLLMSRGIELYRAALEAAEPPPAALRAGIAGHDCAGQDIADDDAHSLAPLGENLSDPRIATLAGYIAGHLDDPALAPETLARACGLGLRSLQRLCRRQLDCSPGEFIRAQRLDAAFTALSRGAVNVAQAAHLAGYSSPANFSTAFKRTFGVTPARAQERGAAAR
ncbi:helix-turn-helix transcriptional regulator [Xinfangfangia sp. D13-10-4-6]|uniref:AraC family transcriptional regulator n=1 Tax=Pseudogemmobacter hezensis TaxID=2737662 RepID=UPI0015567B33|nr:AraC family transcriptional regulator [Pseudogemmobacter hezensis]NPD14803.1 helix-turn-helix transcriptional regulator [Pseudogemmobacter hezensis]